MKKLTKTLAVEVLRELAKENGEPAGRFITFQSPCNFHGRPALLGGVKQHGNLFDEDCPTVDELAEGAYSLLRDAWPQDKVLKPRRQHFKIPRKAWDKLFQLGKGDVVAFLNDFQYRRFHRAESSQTAA